MILSPCRTCKTKAHLPYCAKTCEILHKIQLHTVVKNTYADESNNDQLYEYSISSGTRTKQGNK